MYWSDLTRTLLVGMCRYSIYKVIRYNQSGQLVQTIQHDNTELELYNKLNYITENDNMDIVVSDSGAVVVTNHEGKYLFSYTGYPSVSLLQPGGICTDALSNILVCDVRSNTVQMLDKDGGFLSLIQKELLEMGGPYNLSYDAMTHHLWVASWNNSSMCAICNISQHYHLTGETQKHDIDSKVKYIHVIHSHFCQCSLIIKIQFILRLSAAARFYKFFYKCNNS